MKYLGTLLLLLSVLLSGCSLFDGETGERPPTEEPSEPTPEATPTLIQTREITPIPGAVPPTSVKIWIAAQFSPQNDPEAGSILADQINSFQVSHPEQEVIVEIKTPGGEGGMLEYLRTGTNIAPDVLPDLIMIPSDLLSEVVADGLVYPLDQLLDQEMIEDLFPAAKTMSQFDGETYAYPFALTNLHHLVLDQTEALDPVPTIWEDLLEIEEARFAFPGNGMAGAEMVLQFYMAAGGSLVDESNQPQLEVDLLAEALSPFNRGVARRIILPESASLSTLSDAWQLFAEDDANIVQQEAGTYLGARAEERASFPASVPGFDSPLRPFVESWVWAISTPDQGRQLVAAELLGSLASSTNIGEWSLAAEHVPARQSAFDEWPAADPLTEYLIQASEHAHQFPPEANGLIMDALSTALTDVLSFSQSPRSAAENASALVRP